MDSGYVGWQDTLAADFMGGRIYLSNVYLSYGDIVDIESPAIVDTFVPTGYLTVDPDGTLYVADPYGDTVYAVEFGQDSATAATT